MAQFRPFEPDIEVNGQTVLSTVEGLSLLRKKALELLHSAHIGKADAGGAIRIDPAGWYSQEAWLGVFEQISREVGDRTLFNIGLKIPENASFPPWVADIESAIRAIDVAYHMNHRKHGRVMFDPQTQRMEEGIGHYGFERLPAERRIFCVCDNPYPCDFDFGLITAMARKFEPKAGVVHDMTQPCRKRGSSSCTYVVRW